MLDINQYYIKLQFKWGLYSFRMEVLKNRRRRLTKSQGTLSSLINSEPWQCFNGSHILPLSMVVIFIYRYFSLYLSLSVSHSHSLFLPPSLPLSHSLAISFFFLSLIILYVSLSLFFLFFFFFLCLSFFLSPSLILSYISPSPLIICISSHEIQLCKYLKGP